MVVSKRTTALCDDLVSQGVHCRKVRDFSLGVFIPLLMRLAEGESILKQRENVGNVAQGRI
jgi:hypothetical protein